MGEKESTRAVLRRFKLPRGSMKSAGDADACSGNFVSFAKNFYVHVVVICVCLALSIVYYYQTEDWSVVDSIFFVITTVTSVGYGDDYPSTTRTRTFTIFLMLFGAIVLFGEVSQYLNVGMTKMDDFLKRSDIASLKKTEALFQRRAWHGAFWVIAYTLLGAVALQKLQPDWTYFTALYFIIQTVTSVGYGDIEFHADSIKLFLCAYILCSIALLVIAFHNAYAWFENVKTLARRRKQLLAQSDLRSLTAPSGTQGMNKFEAILAILARTGKLNLEKDVAPLLKMLDAVGAADCSAMSAEHMALFCERNAQECAQKIEQIAQPLDSVEALPIASESPLTTLREFLMRLGMFSDADLYQAEAYVGQGSAGAAGDDNTTDGGGSIAGVTGTSANKTSDSCGGKSSSHANAIMELGGCADETAETMSVSASPESEVDDFAPHFDSKV